MRDVLINLVPVAVFVIVFVLVMLALNMRGARRHPRTAPVLGPKTEVETRDWDAMMADVQRSRKDDHRGDDIGQMG